MIFYFIFQKTLKVLVYARHVQSKSVSASRRIINIWPTAEFAEITNALTELFALSVRMNGSISCA